MMMQPGWKNGPAKLVPGAKSVITLLKNYYPAAHQQPGTPKIARYAFGKDYHEVIRKQLNELIACIKETVGEIHGRGFVDSAPVLERTWAQRSGLGWVGKNGNLINKQSGSYYAILPWKVVDGSKCISYFTIELKEMLIPGEMKGKFDNWMFGCDTCQDVCPWNRFSKPNNEINFTPVPEILNLSSQEWEIMTEESFQKIFKDSPLRRSKFKGIQRNLKFITGTD